jgi:hypothetical protein
MQIHTMPETFLADAGRVVVAKTTLSRWHDLSGHDLRGLAQVGEDSNAIEWPRRYGIPDDGNRTITLWRGFDWIHSGGTASGPFALQSSIFLQARAIPRRMASGDQ